MGDDARREPDTLSLAAPLPSPGSPSPPALALATTPPRPLPLNSHPATRSAQAGQRISYLVDPASSHMLSSKAKPCMSKYKGIQPETANGSLQRS